MAGIEVPRRRKVSADPHPDLEEAVAVSRFWSNVNRSGEGCWAWGGSLDEDGYGEFFYRGRNRRAHELALSFTTGEKRHDSLDTCHSCDNPPCVNPGHLRFDTRKSNVEDMLQRGRGARSGKLSDAQVILIRERRARGARQIDLAEQFGVSDGQISMIVRGLRWPEVGGPIEAKRNQYRKAA